MGNLSILTLLGLLTTALAGLMLLNKGVVLDAVRVEAIQRYYQLDPPLHGVFALVHGKG